MGPVIEISQQTMRRALLVRPAVSGCSANAVTAIASTATLALCVPWLARRRARSIGHSANRCEGEQDWHSKRFLQVLNQTKAAAIIANQGTHSARYRSAGLSRSHHQVFSHQAANVKSPATVSMINAAATSPTLRTR
jgi:hypothetical protein